MASGKRVAGGPQESSWNVKRGRVGRWTSLYLPRWIKFSRSGRMSLRFSTCSFPCWPPGTWYSTIEPEGPVLARSIPDGPDDDFETLRLTLLGAIACARSSVLVVTPYFLSVRQACNYNDRIRLTPKGITTKYRT
jgi:phosphatidylserine/phosphatidylglycerophosphate/cardiolipin synthase-like enzyme